MINNAVYQMSVLPISIKLFLRQPGFEIVALLIYGHTKNV